MVLIKGPSSFDCFPKRITKFKGRSDHAVIFAYKSYEKNVAYTIGKYIFPLKKIIKINKG